MSLRTRLLLALAYVLLLAIVAFGVPLAINLRARVDAEVRTQSRQQADLIAALAADLLGRADRPELNAVVRNGAGNVRGRIIVVDRIGTVLADSSGPALVGTNYASPSRPEIQAALRGRQVQLERQSKTLNTSLLATAAPIFRKAQPAGAVRVTQSVGAVNSAVGRAELGLVLFALIVLALGLMAGAVLAAQVAGPVKRLQLVARRIAQGDLNARAILEGSREQRSLATSFNEMTHRVSRLLRAQREFVADASHQLRTPLTALRLRLEEAQAEMSTPGGPGEPVQLIAPAANLELEAAIAEVDRLSHTVEELLVLSRAGERRLEGAPVDLGDLAAAVVERWRLHARELDISLEYRRRGVPGTVWAARNDLERALDALIENALNYSPPGSTVRIVSGKSGIDVCDQGPGIPDDERELIFERFHRGRAGRTGRPGSGLGLPIARELARAWGGEVEISNADGAGAGAIAALTLPPEPPSPAERDEQPALPEFNPDRNTVASP